jgi:hypothetical protein
MVPMVPWEEAAQWREAQQSLARMASHHDEALQSTSVLAEDIHRRLQKLFPLMKAIGDHTCTRCADPCCETARVWYDFRDLVLYHLLHVKLPAVQPTDSAGGGCRYRSRRGCTLERIARPWICTWYLCPAQKAVLLEAGESFRSTILTGIEGIGQDRKRLESEFLSVVTGCGRTRWSAKAKSRPCFDSGPHSL